jgi:hypothetical protein
MRWLLFLLAPVFHLVRKQCLMASGKSFFNRGLAARKNVLVAGIVLAVFILLKYYTVIDFIGPL